MVGNRGAMGSRARGGKCQTFNRLISPEKVFYTYAIFLQVKQKTDYTI